MNRQITDREVYPALWITVGGGLILFLAWKFLLGAPTISACWIYRNLNIYCPGCGGTRALEAFFRGHILQAFFYHPFVPVAAVLAGGYLSSQMIWRLRGKRGLVLQYRPWWPMALISILLLNCVVRNILLLGFGVKI